MPDIITHYRYAESVWTLLPAAIRDSMDRSIYDTASAGPDPWFFYRFFCPPFQHGIAKRGGIMHKQKCGTFLETLAKEAAIHQDAEVFSFLAGFLCHYTLDKTAHPYIIYRTGNYNGTKATQAFRGNHMYLERAIDWRMLREWRMCIEDKPITRNILTLKRLPDPLADVLDRIWEEIYGWKDASKDFNQCIRHQRLMYAFCQDPKGRVDRFARFLDNGKWRLDLTAVSYFGKERSNLDVMNAQHTPWKHPNDPTLVSTDGMVEIFEKARQEALTMILTAWNYINHEKEDIANAFGNFSYETGFDCDDTRNHLAPQADPFPLKKIQKEGQ